MTELDAQQLLQERFAVSRETMGRFEDFAALLREESRSQNLVSEASLDHLWSRHMLDSAQLLNFAASPRATWVDFGTGAGFPGLVVAALHQGPVTLIEERRLRIGFLERAAEVLRISDRITILGAKVERVEARSFDVISARAFAPLGKLLDLGERFSTANTRWILPKGRNAQSELAAAESSWQGRFRREPSLTDPEAGIIVAEGVRRRAKGRR